MIVTTSCCSNYLAKAATLAATIKSVMPDTTFVLCLVERKVPARASAIEAFDRIVLARDLGFEKFENFLWLNLNRENNTNIQIRSCGQGMKRKNTAGRRLVLMNYLHLLLLQLCLLQ